MQVKARFVTRGLNDNSLHHHIADIALTQFANHIRRHPKMLRYLAIGAVLLTANYDPLTN